MRKEGVGLTLRYEPIPIEKWAVKPEAYQKISHPVQMFIGE